MGGARARSPEVGIGVDVRASRVGCGVVVRWGGRRDLIFEWDGVWRSWSGLVVRLVSVDRHGVHRMLDGPGTSEVASRTIPSDRRA